MIENEDDDPVGEVHATRDPLALFSHLAVQEGLVEPEHHSVHMSDALWSYTMAVVELCAKIGDRYGDGEAGGNAGEHIRAELSDDI